MQVPKRIYPSVVLVALVLLNAGCREPNQFQAPPPRKVTVANPVVQDVTIYLEESAQTESVDRAEVRARVQGFLEEIRFEPGAVVTEGQVLYLIEQRQYQASYDAAAANLLAAQAALAGAQADILVAKATLVAAEADLNVSELDLKRLDSLLPRGAITQSEWDEGKAARDVAMASRNGADANLTSVEAILRRPRRRSSRLMQTSTKPKSISIIPKSKHQFLVALLRPTSPGEILCKAVLCWPPSWLTIRCGPILTSASETYFVCKRCEKNPIEAN